MLTLILLTLLSRTEKGQNLLATLRLNSLVCRLSHVTIPL